GNARAEAINDVETGTVDSTLARFGIDTLIHGHTHRPAIHRDGGRTRIVLGDWYEQGSLLRMDAEGYALETLRRSPAGS
ncbi:MAG TPA: UDP-2,3-diacylglucosamine diphosphatase, partial [Pseudoxanthomonas sp.]|nr:UDP-2,3-diacylglucosamine diphosphatase [Pseudoxanthomonas sp.]